MALTDEQAKTIKEQILKQAESFPEERREEIKSYIESLNNEELEEFLAKNNLVRQQGSEAGQTKADGKQQCVMCLLAQKKIESFVIYEDKDFLAPLEINPFTQGHTILIPKKHIASAKSLPSKAFTLANRIGKHLTKKLNGESFEITSSEEIGHALINILPKFKNKKMDYQRKPTDKKQLQELYGVIGIIRKKEKSIKLERESETPKEKKQSKENPQTKSNKESFVRIP
jgi:histidine triad (HIT) family protein